MSNPWEALHWIMELRRELAEATKCWVCGKKQGKLLRDMFSDNVGYYCEEHWDSIVAGLVEHENKQQEISLLQYQNQQLRERLRKIRLTLFKRNKQIKEIHRASLPEK